MYETQNKSQAWGSLYRFLSVLHNFSFVFLVLYNMYFQNYSASRLNIDEFLI
jgi:hypothetical protein